MFRKSFFCCFLAICLMLSGGHALAAIGFTVSQDTAKEDAFWVEGQTPYETFRDVLLAADSNGHSTLCTQKDAFSLFLNVDDSKLELYGQASNSRQKMWWMMDDTNSGELLGCFLFALNQYDAISAMLPDQEKPVISYQLDGKITTVASSKAAAKLEASLAESWKANQSQKEPQASSDQEILTLGKGKNSIAVYVIAPSFGDYSAAIIVNTDSQYVIDALVDECVIATEDASWGKSVVMVHGILSDIESNTTYWEIALYDVKTETFESLDVSFEKLKVSDLEGKVLTFILFEQ